MWQGICSTWNSELCPAQGSGSGERESGVDTSWPLRVWTSLGERVRVSAM